MTPSAFRKVIALMLSRFDHDVITDDDAPNVITSKAGRFFVTARSFTAEAEKYADSAPLGLIDGAPNIGLLGR